MKKPKEEHDDQLWFESEMQQALTRFDVAHKPDIPELQRFENMVLAHKQEMKRTLWKELAVFWLIACLMFGLMMWMLDRNWVWFAILQAVIAAGGIVFVSMTFNRRKVRVWKS